MGLTLDQITASAKSLADMVNSQYVSPTEWTDYVNRGYSKVYDKMIQAYGTNYYGNTVPLLIPMVQDQEFYPMPDGTLYSGAPAFYKLYGVDYNLTGDLTNPTNWYTIWPFNFGERNRGSAVPRLNNINRPVDVKYRLQANSLWITPTPQNGMFARIWYAPSMILLVAGSDQVQNLQPGWEELIVIYAAIEAKVKAQEDCSDLKLQFMGALADLKDAAVVRDVGAPFTIVDVYANGSGYCGDDGDWAGMYGGGGFW